MGTAEREVIAVHPEHEAELTRFLAYQRRYAHTFLFSMLLGVAALLVFAALGWEPGEAAVLAYLGIILIVFPFTTPTTVEMMGVKSSIRLARAAGAVFVIGAALLLFIQ